MNIDEFRNYGHELIDKIADYYKNIEVYPVKSSVEPGYLINKLPTSAPDSCEDFNTILNDFYNLIMPGITHWQHPKFFGYFPANSSFPSILGELLTSALAAQCMIWETSPAAAELEEVVMNWLRKMIGLPDSFTGVIQDTASTATLCAILMAREKKTNYLVNRKGISYQNNMRIYCSTEAHSSVEKAVKIAGIGSENLRKIPVNNNFEIISSMLESAISADIHSGFSPISVVAAFGTTGSAAVDSIKDISEICNKYNIWLHVDAAYAGSALVLEEYRYLIEGIEYADSFVFNPHKWLFTNFDCSAFFVRDKEALIKTFEIMPEYLKTTNDMKVNNYRDWGIQLGRRFRALKLWFVIRSFGVDGLKNKIREHIILARFFENKLKSRSDFEILSPALFSLVCFRFKPRKITTEKELNKLNELLLARINASGKMYITHTKLNGIYTLRMSISQTNVELRHIEEAYDTIIAESIYLLDHIQNNSTYI